MTEITELDQKYLVLKWDDIEKLHTSDYLMATALCNLVKQQRRSEGKSDDNRYVVLNLDDEIDRDYFLNKLYHTTTGVPKAKVKDIAVDLVNAILKAKEKQ